MTKQLTLLTPIATLFTEVQAPCIHDQVDLLHPSLKLQLNLQVLRVVQATGGGPRPEP